MNSGALILYHLGLLILPLAALALARFRLVPALLFLAVLHHHPMEPMPCDHEPPPICCALAQSVEAEPGPVVVVTVRTFRLLPPPSPLVAQQTHTVKPAIRAPPATVLLPPVPWASVSRAA